jgi:hypothetical protein
MGNLLPIHLQLLEYRAAQARKTPTLAFLLDPEARHGY